MTAAATPIDEIDAANTALRRSSDMIAEALVEEIKTGVLPVGATLPTERALCERFGASRPTVREALTQLQMQGYATAHAGHRPRAARPSLDDILRNAGDLILEILGDAEAGAHLEQMRQFIEMGAAREAAIRADAVALSKLQQALDVNAKAIGTPEFVETDIAFHRALVSVVGNPVILSLHDMFVSQLIAQRPAHDDAERHDRIAHDEHRLILAAVLDGDAATAVDVMDKHLARAYRNRLKAAALASAPA
ncbi:FCD domain-containing protein [Nioella ostreopsis]|jgi:DNA-binding FadR family transcriptional regulator|uniref:FCD domain-containing protein n=1 Tax=Nioella ostreopsis TaxID=2448479 RepID=UPI000FDB6326|nr:FCD domain-containing protein [Nioella ostreopsis]